MKGALRLSKGVWLFAPEGSACLWRVTPSVPIDPVGFFSREVTAELQLKAIAVRTGSGAPRVEPTTGVPARVVGVCAGGVVDAGPGAVFVVDGSSAPLQGGLVDVEVDVDAGVVCRLT